MTFLQQIGQVLRRARESRGLTLRQASNASGREFPPTTLASYERGERSISVERFCRLAALYRVPPERLLADIVREGTRTVSTIDIRRLEQMHGSEAMAVAGLVREIRQLRGDEGDVISLREGDLEILASSTGQPAEQLLEAIAPAMEEGPATSS
jgi:transcriptional regulator with XRE-family HTH domain